MNHMTSPLCRIHDNEGAAEMLIDTLGPEIVNAKDSKNRWDVCRNKTVMTGRMRRESNRTVCDVVSAGHLYMRPPSRTTWSVCSCC